jgi:hypothetical protein
MNSFLTTHTTRSSQEATHLSLVGGKYKIKDSASVKQFRELYISHPNTNYIVERVCYPGYFFMDLDKCRIPLAGLSKLLKSLSDEVFIYSNAIVPNSEMELGIHAIFKNIIIHSPVDAERILNKMCEKVPEIQEYVDHSVYRSGLRMIGSKKSYKVNRIYLPLNKRHLTIRDLENASIHYKIETATPYSGQPRQITEYLNTKYLNFKGIHPLFEKISIQSVQKKERIDFLSDNKQTTFIIISTSKFCPNINGTHKSKNAYFVLNTKSHEVYQKCLCKCAHTSCSTYKSPVLKLNIAEFCSVLKELV